MGKREKSKEEKRAKIMSAAKDVFLEKGYHNSSISDIIGRTDLARGTFYLYFQDKQEIFDSLISDLFLAISKEIYSLEIEKLKTPEDMRKELRKLVTMLFGTLGKHREMVKIVLVTSIGLDNEFDRKVEGYHKLMAEVIRILIRRGIEAHSWRNLDPELFSHIIYGAIREVVFQWLVNGIYKDNLEAEAEQIVEVFLKAVEK